MPTNIRLALVSHRSRRNMAAFAWLCLISLLAVYLFLRLPSYQFDSSLLRLLPVENQGPLLDQRLAAQDHLAKVADRKWLVLVGHKDRATSATLAAQVRQALVSPEWAAVDALSQYERVTASYRAHSSFLLSSSDRDTLSKNPDRILQLAQQRLYSPMGAVVYDAIGDPLFLFQNFIEALAAQQPIKWLDGWPTIVDQQSSMVFRLLSYELNNDAFTAASTSTLPQMVATLRGNLPVDARLLTSGLVFHAAHGAQQARSEVAIIGVGSLLGVFLVLILVFGWATLPMLLPLGAGILAALSASIWLFDSVHLITLAFGASLIGVGIDYAIHARMALNHGELLAHLRKPLLLGLCTSLLAYGLQGLMPFPGLRQMALFSCVGLLVCWVSVWLWFPVSVKSPTAKTRASFLYFIADAWLHIAKPLVWPKAVKISVFIVAVVSLLVLPGDDRVSQLQTSTSQLLEQEQQVAELLQGPQPGRYFLVAAAQTQDLESYIDQLESLLNTEQIPHQSIRQWLPDAASQIEDHKKLSVLYGDSGLLAQWYENLGSPELAPLAQESFFQRHQPLSMAEFSATDVGRDLAYFYSLGEQPFAIIYVKQALSEQTLSRLESPHWVYVDKAQGLSALLAHHRIELLRLLAAAAVLLCLLSIFSRQVSASLFFAPVISAVSALWLVAAFYGGVNLFHCLASLLVLGVGFDSSLMLSLARSAQVAWRGATVSVITSLLAFGLLAACTTPVLKSFGTVAALGLLLVWLLVPIMATPSDSSLRT